MSINLDILYDFEEPREKEFGYCTQISEERYQAEITTETDKALIHEHYFPPYSESVFPLRAKHQPY